MTSTCVYYLYEDETHDLLGLPRESKAALLVKLPNFAKEDDISGWIANVSG
jgi:hypothetical protein